MPAPEHVPDDEANCRACPGKTAWPGDCRVAQAALRYQYGSDRMALGMYLTRRAIDLARATPERPTVDLMEQFFGWLPGAERFFGDRNQRHRDGVSPGHVPFGANAGRFR